MKNKPKSIAEFAGIIVILAIIAIAGLYTWQNYIVPNYNYAKEFPIEIIIGFSFLAGLVSFFSPCALAMFPAYISYFMGIAEGENKRIHSFKKSAILGLTCGAGTTVFFVLLGTALMIFRGSIAKYLSLIQPFIGIIFVILGLALLANLKYNINFITDNLHKLHKKGEGKPIKGIFLYGFAYGGVSLGCTLPIFLALIVFPLLNGKISTTLFAFIAYAIAMAIMMMIVTMLIARSKDDIIKQCNFSFEKIKKISGLILIGVGIYLIYYYLYLAMPV